MNIDTVTTTPLLRANGQHHANARCVECTAGTAVRGATWYKLDELASLRTVGLPVFFDGENEYIAFVSDSASPFSDALMLYSGFALCR